MRTLTLIILCISYAVALNPGEYVLSHFITKKEIKPIIMKTTTWSLSFKKLMMLANLVGRILLMNKAVLRT